ncbi:succinyl-diaminopimelate desuccinylase [Arthrobacter sp. PvP102]|uniref:succinyl-diaminopimelate desuccinylase n=1 Tax=unclassified Arthrobacter TaxID=235627 RepID=UPI0000527C5D|nr:MULTISPECIES: succinyl-diaminopimelate desuccinylase [unclassified Arthrobacter]ABK04184.1 succinyldiaminopimelate desuccinylase [Arthrobacter sp. FB24]MBP1232114.1 succinyl-diaminopimelate desuccinylase [Arthrobacter sp. PvP103]MBP1237249.1 succinyl-diaminopimelate desuccinylase [Arthrobacter sp. PvP102]
MTAQTASVRLDLRQDVALLTAALIDINSVSANEKELADAVEHALLKIPQLKIVRDGDSIIARTQLGRPERVILAGHLDTVPLPTTEGALGTVPSFWPSGAPGEGLLYGRGTTDMKGGVAVQLALAATMFDGGAEPSKDVTFVFYDHEEVEAVKSGLGRLVRNHGELLNGDFAILLEPTHGTVEGGCNGTMRFEATTIGEAAHSARAWMGSNAIHAAAPILARLAAYEPATISVDGLDYRESLNAVKINGGTAGNVIPDRCVVEINYRFAPDKSPEQAEAHVRELLDGFDVVKTDSAAGARPGLNHPAAASFVAAVGAEPKPKYGWTDVARFSELGIPAVNFGPGDPLLAHKDDEHVDADAIRECLRALRTWLAD